jgi:hypothetical protein
MVLLLPLCVLYFIVGLILVWAQVIDQPTYLNGAGIVGAIASVLGLLSFLRPALTSADIKNIEAESLAKLGEISTEIKGLEQARAEAATEINNLEIQKKEMELLVRKASMSLFLRDQYKHHERKILDFLKKQPEVVENLTELLSTDKKLKALDEEIERDENVELLKEIIRISKRSPSPLDKAINSTSSPVQKFALQLLKAYMDSIKIIMK